MAKFVELKVDVDTDLNDGVILQALTEDGSWVAHRGPKPGNRWSREQADILLNRVEDHGEIDLQYWNRIPDLWKKV